MDDELVKQNAGSCRRCLRVAVMLVVLPSTVQQLIAAGAVPHCARFMTYDHCGLCLASLCGCLPFSSQASQPAINLCVIHFRTGLEVRYRLKKKSTVRPPDIVVSGLRFYRDSSIYLSIYLSLLSFARYPLSSLNVTRPHALK